MKTGKIAAITVILVAVLMGLVMTTALNPVISAMAVNLVWSG